MRYIIKNAQLQAEIDTKGCELVSLKDKDGQEYIWEGDQAVWKRHAPVLFPLVGKYQKNTSIYEGKEYQMGQHGFARDMEFELVEHTQDSIRMRLIQTEETLRKYPFAFVLECGFYLVENKVRVTWYVKNPADKAMYFSIGGHPAFVAAQDHVTGCKLTFYKNDEYVREITYRLLDENGLVASKMYTMPLEHGTYQIAENTFDKDAYIIEEHQADRVELSDANGAHIVTVDMNAPVFGLWSAPHTGNPFVCIEPWYGRADAAGFAGTLENRAWGNVLQAGETFEREYVIEV